jgi:hypothetical protein
MGSDADDHLRHAILSTLLYADLFDYPLTAEEIHRYLIGQSAPLDVVVGALRDDPRLDAWVERTDGWYHLAGRARLVELRHERAEASERLWAVARRYGAIIGRLPFVHLVGVTGALAMDNARPDDDVDLFLLVQPGRLWLCRLLVLAIVRAAALRGWEICPNYLLVTDRLALSERNLYTAHEVVQMVPLHGASWYRAFLEANHWVDAFLPNVELIASTSAKPREPSRRFWLTRLAAAVLGAPMFDRVERWEMQRKVRRLTARAQRQGGNVAFSAEECRGHFAAHDQRALVAFNERIAEYEERLART